MVWEAMACSEGQLAGMLTKCEQGFCLEPGLVLQENLGSLGMTAGVWPEDSSKEISHHFRYQKSTTEILVV